MASKFTLTRLFFTVILLFCLSTNSNRVFACHNAAVDMWVRYVGASNADPCDPPTTPTLDYEVYVILYNACQTCQGIIAGQISVTVSSANGGITVPLTQLSKPLPNGYLNPSVIDTNWWTTYPGAAPTANPPANYPAPDTVHSLCPGFAPINSCVNLSNKDLYPAFKRTVMKAIITLPSRQKDWLFQIQPASARNTPLNYGGACVGAMYVEAMLNNVDAPEGSTPCFVSNPLPYLCVNQPTQYLNDPVQFNVPRDSLRVETHEAYYGPGNICTYNAGYSNADPIGSSAANPYTLNPFTGSATFTPTKQGLFVLAFVATLHQPKTGILLSYVWRDVQVAVLPCDAPPAPIEALPQLSTSTDITILETSTGKAIFACPGANISFNINSVGTPGHILYMYATDNNIPGSSFSAPNNGTDNVTGTFTWNPGTSDIGEHPLIITVDDSTCLTGQPIILKNYTSFVIKIVPGIDAGEDQPICKYNPTPRQLFVLGSEGLKVYWTDIDGGPPKNLSDANIHNPIADPVVTTYYIARNDSLAAPCRVRDTVSIYIDTTNTLDVFPQNPFVLCRPDYLQLDAVVTGTGPLTNMNCGINDPTINPPCGKGDSVAIFGSPIFGKVSLDDEKEAPMMPNNVRTTKHQFLLHQKELRQWRMLSSTLNSISFEIEAPTAPSLPWFYDYKGLRISLKCIDSSIHDLSAVKGFDGSLTQVYYNGGTISLTGNQWFQFPFNLPYNWDTTKSLLVEICYSGNDSVETVCNNSGGNAPFMKFARTTYVSGISTSPRRFDVNAGGDGYIPDNIALSVCGVLKSTAENPIIEKHVRPVFGFTYCFAPAVGFNVRWYPGTLLSDSTILQPLAYVPKSTKYLLETYGRSGCILRDSIDIHVPIHDFKVGPVDSAICLGESMPLQVRNGFAYIWHEYENGQYLPANKSLSCTDCPNPVAKPAKTTTYKIEVSDSVFCFDTIQVTVHILAPPKVHILTNDTIAKYGQPLQLQVSGARMYNWTPPSSLNDPNISNPIAMPTEPTMYVVAGIGANGCRTYDTVKVGVDYRDKLMIPSAFSPNGDGRNDEFRITNLTFQRIMEFRVFNRWGQEIFHTSDSRKGWDGTWRGVPQDIGDYQYLFKIGYPDGFVETYKGDVTLVR